MPFRIVFTRQAAKTLRKIPAPVRDLIRQKIEQVAENPFFDHPNVTRLQNRDGYRLRVGDWRVIYEIQQDQVLITVLKIGLRKEVYR